MGPLQTSDQQKKHPYFLHERELQERLARNPLAKIIPRDETDGSSKYSASLESAGLE